MEYQAILNYVIIKPTNQSVEKTENGIILPVKEVPMEGIVISVGKDVQGINPNDRVLFKKWEAVEVKRGSEKLLVFESKNILAILT